VIAEVAVPIAGIEDALSYAVARQLEGRVRPGVRVLVHVGARRVVGLVLEVHERIATRTLKPVLEVLDSAAVVDAQQLALVRFVASYYMAEMGACARLVLPPGTAQTIERRFRLSDRGEQARVFSGGLKKSDRVLLDAFAPGERKSARAIARTRPQRERLMELVTRGFVEEVPTDGAVARVRRIEHLVAVDGGADLPKRATALAAMEAWVHAFTKSERRAPTMNEAEVARAGARGKAGRLVALGRMRVDETVPVVSTMSSMLPSRGLAAVLTEHQALAVQRIERAVAAREVSAFLLEGVTGSGKTEVYLRAVRACLERQRGAILLVPEIGLTPQLVGRVDRALADRPGSIVVLHSGVTAPARRDAYARLREGSARVAVGARSALFAPVRDLGLIVVDEEHDGSLKQDESPRYHARDVALWRARNEGAVCLLGSATPSLETRHNVELKKIEALELPVRVGGGGVLPAVEVIDLRARGGVKEARRRDRLNADEGPGVVLSAPLVDAMAQVLAGREQIVLFLNKRGYASAVLCEMCGHIETCPRCSLSLTLHRRRQVLLCHQCDHERRVPSACAECGNDALMALGLGTERLESEVVARFPDARVARLDRDSVQRKGALEETLARIHAREVDIIVGTQMIAKGHDFPGVGLVGVVLADIALSMPDFRASERAFALIAQVAGRAGRGDKAGRVLVQTFSPDVPAISFALTHDVTGFAARELLARRLHGYPPFSRAALVRVEGEAAAVVPSLAMAVATAARAGAGVGAGERAVLGPAPCAVERIKGRTRWQVFIRTDSVAARTRILESVRAARAGALGRDLARARARLIMDLDPVRLL
jgi:primosomal protein N' (replication factor Y)